MCQVIVLVNILFYVIKISLSNLLGNVYIADSYNNRIRKVTVSTGIITTFAGTGTDGYSGDNGPAASAGLYFPFGVALDAAGTQT
jgi:DNA-binding beta-propeller fold protein YncE